MALNQYGQEEDPNGLMVPDWAQPAPGPVQQIEAPPAALDALGNIGQPPGIPNVAADDIKVTGAQGQPLENIPPALEGPAERPGDRAMPPAVPGAPPAPLPVDAPPVTPVDAPRTTFTPTPPIQGGTVPELAKNAGVTHTSVTQNIASPESQAASKDAASIAEKQIETERRLSEERQKNLAAEQQAADKQQAIQLQKNQQMADLMQEHKQRVADLKAKDDAAIADMRGAKIHDYWADKSTGDRVLAALSMFLGGLGTAYGGENTAAKIIQSNIQRDYDKQREEIQRKHDYQAVTSKNKEGAQAQLNNELHNLDLRQVAATDAVGAQLVSMKAKQGIPLEQAQNDQAVLAIQKLANDKRAEIAEKQDAKVTQETTTKAHGILTGGGSGGAAVTKLVQMAENGSKRSEIVAAAQAAGLPEKVWKNQVDLAFNDREKGAAAKDKAAEEDDKRTVTLDGGRQVQLPTARAVPQFTQGYNSRVQAVEKLKALLDHVNEAGNVWTPDEVERRKALIHDANIAVGSISSMGSSDHSTHLELGTLGPVQPRKLPLIGASDAVGKKLIEDKIRQVQEGTEREIRTMGKPVGGEAEARPTGQAKSADSNPAPFVPPKIYTDKLHALPTAQRTSAAEAIASTKDPTKRDLAKAYLLKLGVAY